MCVSVPGAGRFLQNGFDGWNSKGLEFNTVFLIGADDKVLPHRLSENVEEERRLAYVAVSRAKDNLFVLSQGVPSKFFNMFWRLTPKEKNEEEVGV
jgi:DNA helicase-2/ATP-dependent DNA helicase PcrA